MKKKFAQNNNLLWHYIEVAASNIVGSTNQGRIINIRCNICGDGKNNTSKRGYLIWDYSRDVIYYKCFNYGDCPAAEDGGAWAGWRWLKTYYPTLYKQYIRELLGNKKDNNLSKKTSNLSKKIDTENKIKLQEEANAVKHFKNILSVNNELFLKAINICKHRLIPINIYNKFFISVNGIYKERLIIPFYDAKGEIYYYQARALHKWQSPKYLNRKIGRDDAIYNYHHVDKNKPVVILEGPIDSMFIDNAIATLGLSFTDTVKEKLNKLSKPRYLLDNDYAGKTKSMQLLKNKQYVFKWRTFIKDYNLPVKTKDINEAFIYLKRTDKFSYNELAKYFTKNYYDQLYFT